MVAIRTPRALYVAGRAGEIRAVCQAVRHSRSPLPSLRTCLASATPDPWTARALDLARR